MRLLEDARSSEACPPGKQAMANELEYHGPAGESKERPARQHRRQCGHAELIALGLLFADHATREAEQRKTYTSTARDPGLALLLVVSRNSCNSCRYALPHLARLLKADIVIQFRKNTGELSDPQVFRYDGLCPAQQQLYQPQAWKVFAETSVKKR